ncbi:VOC family protein [Rhodococcus koreensis]
MTTAEENRAPAEPRIAVGSLNHVALGVRDLDASVRFYVEGLGMRQTLTKETSDLTPSLMRLPAHAKATTVFVQGASRVGQIELAQWNLPENDEGRPKRPGDIGMGQLSFPVDPDHIGALHDRLVAMGYEVYSEPTTSLIKNYGPVTLFLCEDPDGNQVELIALPSAETVREFRAQAGKDETR